jgi:hypothetical protein
MANKTNTQQAYCPELGRIITVAEVWDYTFGDKRLPWASSNSVFNARSRAVQPADHP